MLDKGCSYDDLPELYILFICTDDPFDKGVPVYTFNKKCEENGELKLDDGTHIKFHNAKAYMKEKNENIREILEYIDTGKANAEFTERLQAKVELTKKKDDLRKRYMTLELKYRDKMLQGLEMGRAEGLKKGIKRGMKHGITKGAHLKALEDARNFLRMGLTYEQVAEETGLPLSEIKSL